MLPEIELDSGIEQEIEKSKKRFVLNKKTIASASPNKFNVTNNEESYKRFFSLGGTVRKMSTATTKAYMKFKRKRYLERLEKNEQYVPVVKKFSINF